MDNVVTRNLLERVWKCGSGCFSKYFSFQKTLKYIFYFLKIIFDISISKWSENIKNILIWNKKKINLKKKTLPKHNTKHTFG